MMHDRESARNKRLPAYYQIRDQLAVRIAEGEWSLEQALPSENQLAEEAGLSVGTIRKAMQLLVDEGLVERRRGSGTYLRRPVFHGSLFRFFALKLADGEGVVPQSRLVSLTRTRAPERAAEMLGTEDTIYIKRLRSHRNQIILVEDIWLPAQMFPGLETVEHAEIGPLLYPYYFDRYRVLVANAQDEVSFGSASAEDARDLGLAPGDPIALIERTAFAPDDAPVEWRIARGPATQFRYRSRIA
jgi:GntR family transcriptional regulator